MAARATSTYVIGIVAVAIAVIASIALYNYLKGQEEAVKKAVATEEIVVAANNISIGSAINNTQLKKIAWPKANIPEGSFTSADQVVGRRSLVRISPEEPVLESKLIPVGGAPGVLIYKIPEGHRAMTVGVDQVAGVAGFIAPENLVDVVLTISPPGEEPVSKIVLQNVPVLATGQISEQSAEGEPVIVPTVTVDVTPEDAEKLAIASTQGRLQLVLRGAGDTELAETAGADIPKVLSGVSKAPKKYAAKGRGVRRVSAKPQPKTRVYSIEVWRANKKTVETFRSTQS